MAGRTTKAATETIATETITTETTATEQQKPASPNLTGRAKLRAELEAIDVGEFVEGEALDSYLLIDAPPVKTKNGSVNSFYLIHKSGKRSLTGDRPIYYVTADQLGAFDFLTDGNFSAWAITQAIPIVAGYALSPDTSKIEVHVLPKGARFITGSSLKKIRSELSSVDFRWLELRGLI